MAVALTLAIAAMLIASAFAWALLRHLGGLRPVALRYRARRGAPRRPPRAS